ncbi:MAG: hypothetical protein LBC85_06370, partial [Fibromonadaceae bacterium]|nr:hypothetical protein [Fibromonadaceae bacterium]
MNRTPKAMSLFFAIALCFTAAHAQAQPPHFIITGSGTSFTATRDGSPFGTANQPIQTVINAIRAECGTGCGIQFGDG